MLEINEDSIKMTRGDDGYFDLTIYTPNGRDIYEVRKGDRVVFSVRSKPRKTPGCVLLMEKEFKNNKIKLNADDTKFMKPGTYYYDCEIKFPTGDVNTVCEGTFTLVY